MASRSRYASSEFSDRYDDRPRGSGRGARDKRYYEEEEVIRERRPAPPRERETVIKEEVRSKERPRSPPSDHVREDIRIRERARSPPSDHIREDIRIRERARSPPEKYREDIRIRERARSPPGYVREDVRIKERPRSPDYVREEIKIRERSRTPPGYVREEYMRAQPMLRGRVREDFEFAPRPKPRSPTPSPPPPPRIEREEIIIGRREPEIRREPPPRDFEREEIIVGRREPEPRREPPPQRDFEREEIIVRNNDREPSRRPPRERDFERDELIIRDGPPAPRSTRGVDYERDEYVSRRGGPRDRSVESRYDRGPPRGPDYDREEVIIRHDHNDSRGPRRRSPSIDRGFDREEIIFRRDDRGPPPPPTMTRAASPPRSRYYDDFDRESRHVDADAFALTRVRSHERARSVSRHPETESKEIVIRRDRDERVSRRGGSHEREREEIIIRRNERDRSSSPTSTIAAPIGPPEPPVIRAPPIHQEVITHHRHIDHGYEVAIAPRPVSRPPSPPSPPPPPAREERDETIEIHRRGERNGRPYDEDIIISDRDREQTRTPLPPPGRRDYGPPPELYRSPYADSPRRPYMDPRDERDIREEAEYYNNRATDRGFVGEGHAGATRDWAIVDVPPGTRRVRMDGAGGGAQEVTWARYNGVRRSKFMPDGGSDEGYGSAEVGPLVPAAGGAQLGRRYEGVRDKKDNLWTEITKDLVVKEALTEAGYEFEETDDFYYVVAYLKYDDIAHLVGLSEDIRKARRRRIKEMGWERKVLGPPDKRSSSGAMLIEEEKRPLMIEAAKSEKGSDAGGRWDREDEIYREREVTVRGPPRRPPW